MLCGFMEKVPIIRMNHDRQLSLKIKYLKLKRVNGLNSRLRGELSRERITASNACLSIVNYVSTHKDYVIPDIWGYPRPGTNHFREGNQLKLKGSQLSGAQGHGTVGDSAACCVIM